MLSCESQNGIANTEVYYRNDYTPASMKSLSQVLTSSSRSDAPHNKRLVFCRAKTSKLLSSSTSALQSLPHKS